MRQSVSSSSCRMWWLTAGWVRDSSSAAVVSARGSLSAGSLLKPIACNFLVIALGAGFAVLLSKLLSPGRSPDNRLILAIALLLGLCGLCTVLDVSPLLSCMVFGAVYINLTRDKVLYRQLNAFKPPVLSLFFVVSGMNLDLRALAAFGSIGAVYFLVRILGKYAGAWLGCAVTKTDVKTRNWLGPALVSHAGVLRKAGKAAETAPQPAPLKAPQ